jgi:hypothetical protein
MNKDSEKTVFDAECELWDAAFSQLLDRCKELKDVPCPVCGEPMDERFRVNGIGAWGFYVNCQKDRLRTGVRLDSEYGEDRLEEIRPFCRRIMNDWSNGYKKWRKDE